VLIRNARAWPTSAAAGDAADAELAGVAVIDVRIAGDRITECGAGLPALAGEEEIDADGCALLPGLHDHHVHLRALAAAQASIRTGPERVRTAAELLTRLREADAALPAGAWLRCVGYHESVAGPLDRWALDRMLPNPDRPVRVQHRTGALWVMNSAALASLGLDEQLGDRAGDHAGDHGGGENGGGENGVERDADGRVTGRLWRMDRWLAGRVPAGPADLAAALRLVSARAAGLGVIGFTDATPGANATDVAGLGDAVAGGTIVQRLLCMASADVPSPVGAPPAARQRFSLGPVKIILDDDTLPSLDDFASQVRQAHAAQRPVAVHCVTRVQLILTLAALDAAGRSPGDRIEHGAVIPAETVPDLRGLTVVSQPHFVAERGGQYATDVAPEDRPDLWRLRSLIDAGVAVAAGSDAPFGGADPWHVMRAATRRPPNLGPGEAVAPATALRLFLGEPSAPGVPRLVAPGHPADLILLRCPPAQAARSLASDLVAATFVGGQQIYGG
jgi:predicted amidohydrolase YtcJ